MSLQFVAGNSGSGKTEYLFGRVTKEAGENPDKNYLVIVPEQFTMQTQRKLVELSGNHAIMNIDVLSFKRLAYRVFDDLGIRTLSVLEDTGKNLVIRKVAQEREEELSVLRGCMSRMGYVSEMKSILSELQQYNVGKDELKAYLDRAKLPPALFAKLRDVLVMYEGFSEFMEEKYITSEEILHVLGRVAQDSALIRDAVIVFDEFTGFTPVQSRLLTQLMPLADRIYVTLTVDVREDICKSRGEQDLFRMPKETLAALMKSAHEAGIEVREPILLDGAEKKRFAKAPAIAFMEKNLFRISGKKKEGKPEEITMHSLPDARQELIFAARKIHDLVHNKGYRYREIAVVTGAVENYQTYAQDVFSDYRIPVYTDRTKEILFHPFIEFIRASLELISSDFSYEAVMRCLRSGFCNIAQEDLDELDNYLRATGIRGRKKWSKIWLLMPKGMQPEELEKIEALRQSCFPVWEDFAKAFSKKELTVLDQVKALYQMLDALEAEEKLHRRAELFDREGQSVKAQEYEQIFRIVMQLLEKYVGVLGKEQLSVQEFSEILDAGLDALNVATIPQGYDCVTLGDIERTRLGFVKVLFFVGVNDGIVPKATERGGILSQYERELLKQEDLALAPGAREQAFIQKYYLYLNMTKPTERLYLTYHRIDAEGKATRPSYLIRALLSMFPDMKVKEQNDLAAEWNVSTTEAAMAYLLAGERDENWMTLAKVLKGDEKVNRLLAAGYWRYDAARMKKTVAESLYGRDIRGSVTRLEQFAECAYSHFLKYGLRLKERQDGAFQDPDIGNLYHGALERYSRMVSKGEYDWFTIKEKERDELADRAFQEEVAAYFNQSMQETAAGRNQLDRLAYVFRQTVWALTTQVQKGQFEPKEFEIAFYEAADERELVFSLRDGASLTLNGRIDRVDVYEDREKIAVKVIDYKSGRTKFQLLKVYRGTQLQLVVYMNAALAMTKKKGNKEIVPGGIFYYHIDDPVLEMDEDDGPDLQEELLKRFKLDGIVNEEEEIYRAMDDEFETESLVIPVALKKDGSLSGRGTHAVSTGEFEIIGNYVRNQIAEAGNAILDGEISIAPQKEGEITSCRYCPYQSVCGFDRRLEGFSYRNVRKLDKEEILSEMEKTNAIKSKKI